MAHNTQTLFIGENESKAAVYERFNGLFDSRFLIDAVFNKSSNNKVGYYLFRDNGQYFRIFVLPKHLKIPKDKSEEKETILHFLEYLGILSAVELFFKKHRAAKRKLVSYTSQTIRHRFDLKRNIKEPDKTKIHQLRHEDIIYSELANITYGALKLFVHNKLSLIKDESIRENLLKHTREIQRSLKRTFRVESGKRITPYMLVSSRVSRHFRKKQSFVQLYVNILSLFGMENFFEEDTPVDLNRDIRSEAFFLDPALLYEWYTYDTIKKRLHTEEERYTISLDKYQGTAVSYKQYRSDRQEKPSEKTSNPDITVLDTETNRLYVIDAKWKFLNGGDPELSDILKLKRDCEARKEKEYSVHALFLYPDAGEVLFKEHLNTQTIPTFSFYTRSISFSEDTDTFSFDTVGEPALPSASGSLAASLATSPKELAATLEAVDMEDHDIQEIVSTQLAKNVKILHKEILKEYSLTEILDDPFCHPLRDFISQNSDVLEKECREFIHSSASSMFYFQKHTSAHYDYSLPASGLWKSIEVELNASVIFLLRYNSKICSKEKYNRYIKESQNFVIETGRKSYQKVYLRSKNRKNPEELDNIMLGSFPHLFKNIYATTYDDGIMERTFLPFYTDLDTLKKDAKHIADFLFAVLKIRNPHTHKDLMEKEKFDTFIRHVFENETFNFYDLVALKRKILSRIRPEESHEETTSPTPVSSETPPTLF